MILPLFSITSSVYSFGKKVTKHKIRRDRRDVVSPDFTQAGKCRFFSRVDSSLSRWKTNHRRSIENIYMTSLYATPFVW